MKCYEYALLALRESDEGVIEVLFESQGKPPDVITTLPRLREDEDGENMLVALNKVGRLGWSAVYVMPDDESVMLLKREYERDPETVPERKHIVQPIGLE